MYEPDDLYQKWRKENSARHWYWGMESQEAVGFSLPVASGFWVRVAAWLVDKIVLIVVTTVFLSTTYLTGFLFPSLKERDLLLLVLLVFLSLEMLRVAYYVIFHGTNGQTIGKAVLGIKVVDADGNPPTLPQAYRRRMAHLLSLLLFGLGYLWIIFDPKKQALHDKLAGTYVVGV